MLGVGVGVVLGDVGAEVDELDAVELDAGALELGVEDALEDAESAPLQPARASVPASAATGSTDRTTLRLGEADMSPLCIPLPGPQNHAAPVSRALRGPDARRAR